MDTTKGKLSVGNRVAFRRSGIHTGIVTETGVIRSRRSGGEYHKIKGDNGWKGATVQEHCAIRIPAEDEVIVSKKELLRLKMRDSFLSRLEAAGVDNWDGYSYAVSGEGDDDDDEEDGDFE